MADMPGADAPAGVASTDDRRVIDALRARDEATFATLVDRYSASLVRLARVYVHDQSTAEEVVQDAWIGLLESLDRFEGRSSLKTWLFRILINCARSRARKDSRAIPFSSAFTSEDMEGGDIGFGSMTPSWFPVAPGHWIRPPAQWDDGPEARALAAETRAQIERSIGALPPAQREVITLRDVAGFDAAEVCNLLGLTDTNQRVLLHRARGAVRRALEPHMKAGRA
jgi:RNA polymerase sigma-70 factor (ECF subfamily)